MGKNNKPDVTPKTPSAVKFKLDLEKVGHSEGYCSDLSPGSE